MNNHRLVSILTGFAGAVAQVLLSLIMIQVLYIAHWVTDTVNGPIPAAQWFSTCGVASVINALLYVLVKLLWRDLPRAYLLAALITNGPILAFLAIMR